MTNYNQQAYIQMYDQLLSQELCYEPSAASETNIKRAMKRVLGLTIKQGLIKRYSDLVLDESLDVHFKIIDADGTEFELKLIYGS
jgi:hypothetical protein